MKDPRLKNFTEKRELLILFMKTFGIDAKDIKIYPQTLTKNNGRSLSPLNN